MALIKTANSSGKYFDNDARTDVLSYILNPRKAPHHHCFGLGVDMTSPATAAESMRQTAALHNKDTGIRLHHFIIAFQHNEIRSLKKLASIAWELTCLVGYHYQVVVAVHEDTWNPNIHICWNSVSFVNGERYRGTRKEFFEFKAAVQNILLNYGIHECRYAPASSLNFM